MSRPRVSHADLATMTGNFATLFKWFRSLLGVPNPIDQVWDLGEQRKKLPAQERHTPPESFRKEWSDALDARVREGCPYLPLKYQKAYVEPLRASLDHVIRSHDNPDGSHERSELLAGAVTQHLPTSPARHSLRQFLAVVSNLYRSFLDPDKRLAAKIPLAVPNLPPLAVFRHRRPPGDTDPVPGPIVLTSAMTRLLCNSEVAVIVLPGEFHRSPLAWAPLAHETTGHSVLQADPCLLPDIMDGIRSIFGGGALAPGAEPDKEQSLRLLWTHWAEEAASDVCGLLNIGPAFAVNLAALLAAYRTPTDQSDPMLAIRMDAKPEDELGPHPLDVLRLYLASGVIQSYSGLSPKHKAYYVRLIEGIAEKCAGNAPARKVRKVLIRGRVPVERDRWVSLDLSLSLSEAAAVARRVGAFIASGRFGALGNHTIQDVETWDDSDEEVAQTIARTLNAPPKAWDAGVFLDESPGNVSTISIGEALQLNLGAAKPPEHVAKIEQAFKGSRFGDFPTEDFVAIVAAVRPAFPDELRIALAEDRIEEFWQEGQAAPPGAVSATQGVSLDLVASLGDDAQLLAGSTLAALADPSADSLRWINQRLAYALTRSFHRDGLLGSAVLHQMFDPATTPAVVNVSPVAVPREMF